MKREELRIISGGQTGVDRAALDAAIEAGVDHAGWCPKGRRAEDGRIHPRYQLKETPQAGYLQRTIWNVRDAEITLILFWEELTGGTWRTQQTCHAQDKPYYGVNLAGEFHALGIGPFPLMRRESLILNVAGPRASKHPLVYERAKQYMDGLILELLK